VGFVISKARARSGVIRVCDKGMSSSSDGSSSSHLENQLESSSLIFSKKPNSLFSSTYFSGLKNTTKGLDLSMTKYEILNGTQTRTKMK
jgi:hypothetical protein